MDKDGTRLFQKWIRRNSRANVEYAIRGLQKRVHQVITSPHGNFVLLAAIDKLKAFRLSWLLEEIGRFNLDKLWRQKYAARVLHRIFEKYPVRFLQPIITKMSSTIAEDEDEDEENIDLVLKSKKVERKKWDDVITDIDDILDDF